MFPFSEGLAAVVNEDYKMGFIDTSGKLVIPLQFDAPFNQVFIPYGSLFRNGRAWVFSFSEDYDLDIGVFSGQPMTRTFTQIDKNGNKIPGTEVKVSMRWSGPESKEIRTYGLFCVYSTGIDGFDEECYAPGVGTFYARFGNSDTGLTFLATGKKFADGTPEIQPYVVTRNTKDKVSPWAKNEIDLARKAGLVTEHTQFYLTHDITRSQFAELIVNFVEMVTGREILPAAENTFMDTADIATLKAYAAGIVSGVGNNRFDPAAKCNREQIAAMIYRAISYIQTQTSKNLVPNAADLGKFSDKSQVSSWAVEGMGVLAANGIMAGTSSTTLSLKATCTIEQSILLIYRLYMKTVQ